MKRASRVVALVGVLAVAITAGTGVATAGNSKGEGKVVIVAWPGYIEDGSTDEAYDWVTAFEKKTGCQVEVKTAGTSDEMVALMTGSPGDYDLVTASGDASNRLIAGKTVRPVNVKTIKGYKTVDERLQDAPWHTVKGKHYGVPYQWGTNVLMYNTSAFPTPPDSWSVVFEPQALGDGQPNDGRVQAYDGPIYIADAALYLKATQPDLGIEDPYELTRDQFDAALDLLRQQRDVVGRYWHDATIQIEDFTNEGYVASSSWPFQVNILQAERPADRQRGAEGGRHGLGGHDDAGHRRSEPEVRQAVAGALDHAEGPG